MKKNSSLGIYILLLVTFILTLEPVNAENSTVNDEAKTICLTDGIAPRANGITKVIESSSIRVPEIFNGNINGNVVLKENSGNKNCAITNVTDNGDYEFKYCGVDDKYNGLSEKVEITATAPTTQTGKFRVSIKLPDDISGDWPYIYMKICFGDDCTKEGNIDINTGIPKSFDRTINFNEGRAEFYIDIGGSYFLVFMKKDVEGICNDMKFMTVSDGVPTTVGNPYYGGDICPSVRGLKGTEESIAKSFLPECWEKELSSEDYINFVIKKGIFTQWDKFNDLITKLGNKKNYEIVSETNSSACEFDSKSNSKENILTYTSLLKNISTTTYWNAVCTETLSLKYDIPKAVIAGTGFAYQADVTIERTCTPIQIKKPKLTETCGYRISCWGDNHIDTAGAGPNEDFDACINTCDGGQYTQNCINSCYNSVYKTETSTINTPKLEKLSFQERVDGIKTIANNTVPCTDGDIIGSTRKNNFCVNRHTFNPVSSRCVVGGNYNSRWYRSDNSATCISLGVMLPDKKSGNECSWYKSEHGVSFHYCDSCNGEGVQNGTKCYEVYRSSKNCSENSVEQYITELKKARAEYEEIIKLINDSFESNDESYKQNEIYSMIIDEIYENDKTTQTTFDNKNARPIGLSETSKVTTSNNTFTTTISDEPTDFQKKLTEAKIELEDKNIYFGDIIISQTYTLTRNITLQVGSAYVSKNGQPLPKEDNPLTASNTVTYNKSLDDKFYNGPYNKYFTSLSTKENVNNYKGWPYYNKEVPLSKSTDEYTKNINIKLKNIGTWNQWGTEGKVEPVSIACFYGTSLNNLISSDGIQYIFRPINLTDMFPNNRNPRWNWTDKASLTKDNSLYGVDISPSKLIEDIQTKGQSIYDVSTNSSEVDYEFVLTRENIRNIRNYNKNVKDYNDDGQRNYLDYNMSCYKNSRGQEICTSQFLDNINGNSGSPESSNFITYSVPGYGIDARKSIAGCNNAKNGTECDLESGN